MIRYYEDRIDNGGALQARAILFVSSNRSTAARSLSAAEGFKVLSTVETKFEIRISKSETTRKQTIPKYGLEISMV
jgi:hypothetical protein